MGNTMSNIAGVIVMIVTIGFALYRLTMSIMPLVFWMYDSLVEVNGLARTDG